MRQSLFLLMASMLTLGGCQSTVPVTRLGGGFSAQGQGDNITPEEREWLQKIPPDLQAKPISPPTPDEMKRAEQLADLYRHVHFGRGAPRSSNYIQTLAGHPSLLDEASLDQVRGIVREGPVRFGSTTSRDGDLQKYRASANFDMPGELLQSAARELVAGKGAVAVDDLGLATKYEEGIPEAQSQFSGGSFVASVAAVVNGILDQKLLKREELIRLAAALPTPERIASDFGENEKQTFAFRVRELAKMKAPRTDLVISNSIIAGEKPKYQVKVPPHGTLDKSATLDLMCKIERIDLANSTRMDGGFDDSAIKLVKAEHKGLPAIEREIYEPSQVAHVQSQVKPYVDGMNRQPNSLGREFLRAKEKFEFGFSASLLEKYGKAYRRLQIAVKE